MPFDRGAPAFFQFFLVWFCRWTAQYRIRPASYRTHAEFGEIVAEDEAETRRCLYAVAQFTSQTTFPLVCPSRGAPDRLIQLEAGVRP